MVVVVESSADEGGDSVVAKIAFAVVELVVVVIMWEGHGVGTRTSVAFGALRMLILRRFVFLFCICQSLSQQ